MESSAGNRCAVSLMVYPPADFQNGPDAEKASVNLFQIPGIADMSLKNGQKACELIWKWDEKQVDGVLKLSVVMPKLPGKQWHHLLFTWDCEKGSFFGYLNGTPMRQPGTAVAPWTMPAGAKVKIEPGEWETKGIEVIPQYIASDRVMAKVPEELRGRASEMLGEFKDERKPLDLAGRMGKTLYESALDSPESVADWKLEGPGIVKHADGWMRMSSERPDGPNGHIVHWAPADFPASFIAEWEIQMLKEDGLCIVFFSAKGMKGEDIFDPALPQRDGIFSKYHSGAIDNYHISYYANNPDLRPGRVTSNLRKNNGFYLADNGPSGIEAGSTETHKARLVRDAEHIQLLMDGKVIIDFIDDGQTYGPVHGGGKIGLRQMQWTDARYRNFRVRELLPTQ